MPGFRSSFLLAVVLWVHDLPQRIHSLIDSFIHSFIHSLVQYSRTLGQLLNK